MKYNLSRHTFGTALVLSALLFSACRQAPADDDTSRPLSFSEIDMTTADISADALATHLLDALTFDDANLIRMDDEIAANLYNIAGLAETIVSYGSTGATAEAVLVVKCASETDAAAAKSRIEQYRVEMAAVYRDYNVPESDKLSCALLSCDGRYVVFCVAPDEKAATEAYQSYVTDTVNAAMAAE